MPGVEDKKGLQTPSANFPQKRKSPTKLLIEEKLVSRGGSLTGAVDQFQISCLSINFLPFLTPVTSQDPLLTKIIKRYSKPRSSLTWELSRGSRNRGLRKTPGESKFLSLHCLQSSFLFLSFVCISTAVDYKLIYVEGQR